MKLLGGIWGGLQNPAVLGSAWPILKDINCTWLETSAWGMTTEYAVALLDEAQRRGLKVSLFISNPVVTGFPDTTNLADTFPNDPARAIAILGEWIANTRLVGHPALAHWRVLNEPSYWWNVANREPARIWFTEVYNYLHSIDPTHKIALSTNMWRISALTPEHFEYLSSIPSDMLDVHYYSWMVDSTVAETYNAYVAYLSLLKSLNEQYTKRPIVLGEFGLNVVETGSTEQERAQFYSDVFRAVDDIGGLDGLAFYLFYDMGRAPNAELLHVVDGAYIYKPALYTIKEYYATPKPFSIPIALAAGAIAFVVTRNPVIAVLGAIGGAVVGRLRGGTSPSVYKVLSYPEEYEKGG